MLSGAQRIASHQDHSLDRNVMLGIVALIPMGILSAKGHTDLDAGICLSVLVLPVTHQTTLKNRIPRRLLILLLVALVCGPVLTQLAITTPARAVNRASEIETLFATFAVCVTIPTVYWSVMRSGWARTLNVFALGMIVQGVLDPSAWGGNAWKYVFAWPITALLLPKRGWVSESKLYGIALAFALVVVSILFHDRSFVGFLCGAVLIGVLASHVRRTSVRTRSIASVAVVCLVTIVLYFGGSYAATHGLLGPSIQLTSQQQTTSGKGLLIGARPENGAALALFASRPMGFGPGVVPSVGDIDIAKSGLARLGSTTSGSFVNQYLFGGRLELHSVLWDLWVNFGLVGLVAGAYLGWLCVKLLFRSVSTTRAVPIVLLALGFSAIWDVLFSPSNILKVDIVTILVMLGFVLSAQQMDKNHVQPDDVSGSTRSSVRGE
jgi:hypothetical protein